jgi:membrane-bound serine protease (ClpP class)
MIHHPVAIGAKLILLIVIIIALIVLHGVLTPEQFRVALVIAAVAFCVGVVLLWVLAYKIFSNPKSRLGRYLVLWKEERAEDGYTASPNEFRDMVGHRGVALSPLRPAGTAQFGDKRVSVVTEGGFIEKGASVEIFSAAGSRVVVREAPPPEGSQTET